MIEMECSISSIDNDANTATVDFWGGNSLIFTVGVELSKIPEELRTWGDRFRCILEAFNDGSEKWRFDYPRVDLDELRELLNERKINEN